MQLLQSLVLGLIQGLTEFIPVSSSGHLLVVGHLMNFKYSGLAFDTSLDIGTLAALYLFFWKDFWNMAVAVVTNKPSPERRLAWLILLGTIPAVVVGVVLENQINAVFHLGPHAPFYVAINLIWVAILMLVLDRFGAQNRKVSDVNATDAGAIGLTQALALIPGVSRSGITISAGRGLGFDRVSATRFSFLLSAPVITAATAKEVLKGSTLHQMASVPLVYLVSILAAFVAGYLAIRFLLNYLGRYGLALFAYYRLIVGVLILVAFR